MTVKAGDLLGFAFTDGSPVCYDGTGDVRGKYCAKGVTPKLGDVVSLLKGKTTSRDYAIRARYQPVEVGKYHFHIHIIVKYCRKDETPYH